VLFAAVRSEAIMALLRPTAMTHERPLTGGNPDIGADMAVGPTLTRNGPHALAEAARSIQNNSGLAQGLASPPPEGGA
jgi:hypothetical protein